MDHVITFGDILQLALLLAACFACYVRGKITGIELILNDLLNREKIKLEDVTDLLD